jgi:hypothetical protein
MKGVFINGKAGGQLSVHQQASHHHHHHTAPTSFKQREGRFITWRELIS